jgi:hypothetical protein
MTLPDGKDRIYRREGRMEAEKNSESERKISSNLGVEWHGVSMV